MFTIEKEFTFSASHHLKGLPETHPCSRDHGHNYKIIVKLTAEKLNEIGFVVDYRELDVIKEFIDTTLDHRNLNEVFPFNPTAENIAQHLFGYFKLKFHQVSAVTIKETDKTSATYQLNVEEVLTKNIQNSKPFGGRLDAQRI